MQPTVLILGANGRFGRAAVTAFAAQGWQVLALARSNPHRSVDAHTHWVPGDVAQWPAVVDTLASRGHARVDVVVHALNPKQYTGAAWRRDTPVLMEAAIGLAQRLGATLMLPGNVYNFGSHMPARLDEATPQNADTVKGQVRVAMEQQLAQAVQQGRVRAVIVRAGDFFGHDAGTWLDIAMAKKLDRGQFTWMGRMDATTPWAYLPDLAQAFALLAAKRAELPAMEVVHFAGHAASGLTWQQACTRVARERGWLATGAELKVSAMPWGLFGLLRWAVPLFASLHEIRYLWSTPHALDNRRLLGWLGSEPHTDFQTAVARSLDHVGPRSAPMAVQPART